MGHSTDSLNGDKTLVELDLWGSNKHPIYATSYSPETLPNDKMLGIFD